MAIGVVAGVFDAEAVVRTVTIEPWASVVLDWKRSEIGGTKRGIIGYIRDSSLKDRASAG